MNERERIESLIARSDFRTAEAAIRKAGLSPEDVQELTEQIARRERQREQERIRERRKKRFLRGLQRLNFYGLKWFLGFFIVLGLLAGAYELAVDIRGTVGILLRLRPLVDVVYLVAAFSMALFWGLVILEAVLDRDHWSLDRFQEVFLLYLVLFVVFLFCYIKKYVL